MAKDEKIDIITVEELRARVEKARTERLEKPPEDRGAD